MKFTNSPILSLSALLVLLAIAGTNSSGLVTAAPIAVPADGSDAAPKGEYCYYSSQGESVCSTNVLDLLAAQEKDKDAKEPEIEVVNGGRVNKRSIPPPYWKLAGYKKRDVPKEPEIEPESKGESVELTKRASLPPPYWKMADYKKRIILGEHDPQTLAECEDGVDLTKRRMMIDLPYGWKVNPDYRATKRDLSATAPEENGAELLPGSESEFESESVDGVGLSKRRMINSNIYRWIMLTRTKRDLPITTIAPKEESESGPQNGVNFSKRRMMTDLPYGWKVNPDDRAAKRDLCASTS